MKTSTESCSLIPYLASGNERFYLRLSPVQPDSSTHFTDAFPFPVISDAAAFSAVLPAALHSDADQSIVPLLLLIQKDEYTFENSEAAAITNVGIEQQWRDLFSRHFRSDTKARPLFLKDQIGSENTLLPFQPLFFCRWKQAWFAPPCPYCGNDLDLCRNEAVLKNYGLQSYSETIARYLYCPSCISDDRKADFYVFSKKTGAPGFLTEKDGLIRKIQLLPEGPDHKKEFVPCLCCRQWQTCYGPEELALKRISVFSFYPFFMLVFHADSISADDRRKMESGACFGRTAEASLTAEAPPKTEEPIKTDPDLAAALRRILYRWRAENQAQKPAAGPDPAGRGGGQDLQETLIISRNRPAAASGQEPVQPDLQKTRIVSPAAGPADSKPEPGPDRGGTHPVDSEKTRIVAPPPGYEAPTVRLSGQSGETPAEPIEPPDEKTVADRKREELENVPENALENADNGLEKTMIIDRRKIRIKE